VTSAKGCKASKSVTVTVNPLPELTLAGTDVICFGERSVLSAKGGASYTWNTGATTSSITVAPETTTEYTVEAKTDKGCTSTKSMSVTVNSLPEPVINGNTVICFGGNTELSATGGASYKWSNGSVASSIDVTPDQTTTYTVEATTDKGCKASKSVTVTVNDKPVFEVYGDKEICIGESTTLTASGGVAFRWSNGEMTQSITISPEATTTYTVEVTSGKNCSAERSVEIIVNPLPEISMTSNTAICYGDKLRLLAEGGAGYRWLNTNARTAEIEVSPEESTEYTVEVTSDKGCSSSKKMMVTVNPLPTISFEGEREVCYGLSTTLSASGGVSYSWSTGSDAASVTVAPRLNTTYEVEVTTANGCKAKESVAVSVKNCGSYCTYSQYSFSTLYATAQYAKDDICVQEKSETAIEYAISNSPNGVINIGEGRLVIRSGDAPAVITFLPHAGASSPMNSYGSMDELIKDKSVMNQLLAQTITLGINMGLNPGLAYFRLQGGYMITEGSLDCGMDGRTNGKQDCFYLDPLGLADVDGDQVITVNDVWMIANMYLAGKKLDKASIETISDLVENLNKAWQGCRTFKRFADQCNSSENNEYYIKVYPNPFKSYVNFEFTSPVSGTAILEIWDMAGRKIEVSAQGNVSANKVHSFRYNAPRLSHGQYIYRITVGTYVKMGKIMTLDN
jgi:hypothetical protein